MIPISRKPSFQPPPPPPYQQNKLPVKVEGLHGLQLQHPTPPRPHPPRDPPIRLEMPSPALKRAPSPMPVIDANAGERIQGPSRPRALSAAQSPAPEPQGPSLQTTSAAPTASAHTPAPHSSHGATAAAPPPPLPLQPSSHPDPHHAEGHSPTNRHKFRPFAALGLSRAPRQAIGQITDQLITEEREKQAARNRQEEEIARQVSAQDMARDNVRTLIEALLRGRLPPDDERNAILSACAQECESEGLDLSTVLQGMLIEGYPPIYWAIVNRAVASERTRMAPDSLVFALLKACRPFSPATISAIRLACMMASDNALLQRLFRSIPQLSHISTRDALLLGPANEEECVDVEDRRNGTGPWVASIKIPRFCLCMRVCQSVSVEFVASGVFSFLACVYTLTLPPVPGRI